MQSFSNGRAPAIRGGGFRIVTAALPFILPLLLGCDGGVAARTATAARLYGGTLVVAAPTDLDQANPLVTADAWTQEVNRFLLFMPLVRYGPALEIEPYLARSWTPHGDTAVTFFLRDDVLWNDGTKTTAYDVRFTYERALEAGTAYPNAGYLRDWTSVEVIDSFTVRLGFRPHADPFAGVALLPIVPEHVLGAIPPEQLKTVPFNRAPVGNGPFRFVSWLPGDRWVFEANSAFPRALGGRPLVDRLVWRVVPDRTAQVAELLAGNAHLIVSPPPERFEELSARSELRGIARPSFNYAFIGWNGQRAPFDDARVRRALTMAIDRAAILRVLRSGFGELATGPVHPHHWAHDQSLEPIEFDTTRARALLAAAGITDRNGNGRLETAAGAPFRFELKVPAANDFNRKVAELVQADLARIGIDLRLRLTDWNTLVADVSSTSREFDAVLMGWAADFRIDLHGLFHSASIDGPFQLASYRNAAADALMDHAASIVSRDEALPVWHQLQHILREDQPWSFLYYFPDLILARDAVHGVELDLRGVLATAPAWWLAGDRVLAGH